MDYEYITFDCYGTLVDWEQGIYETLSRYIQEDREVLLQAYARAESEVQKDFKPYKEVLVQVMELLARRFGIKEYDRYALLRSFYTWEPFEDTREALRRIGKKYSIAIISNVDEDMFRETLKKLDVKFDVIVLSEHVGRYKPDEEVFKFAIGKLGTNRLLHVAQSCYHDILPTNRLGIDNAHIIRRGYGATLEVPCKAKFSFRDLLELCEFLGV